MSVFVDMKIVDDDLVLDSAGNPVFVYDRDVIAQDLRHAIRESGILYDLIGESRLQNRQLVFNKLQTLVESDRRVLPGTSEVSELSPGNLLVEAQTEFGPIEWQVFA